MAANPNRKITEEQFVEGSTIDGTRIDKAFSDTYSLLNSVPKANLKQMYVPRTYYSGWQAARFNASDLYADANDLCFPLNGFFSLYNSFTRDVQGNTGARTAVNNDWRWKGTQIGKIATDNIGNPFFTPAQPANSIDGLEYNYSDVVGRTWSLYLEKPCIITDIAVILERDNYTGLYNEIPLGGEEEIPFSAEEIANFSLLWWGECFLDSVFNADDKRKGSVLWRRVEKDNTIPPEGLQIPQTDRRGNGMVPRDPTNVVNWVADRSNRIPNQDFLPNNYQNAPVFPSLSAVSNHPVYSSWWDKNLNIPVPQQSRIHFGFGYAVNSSNEDIAAENYGDFSPYKFDTKFHQGYRYNVAVGFLELVEK